MRTLVDLWLLGKFSRGASTIHLVPLVGDSIGVEVEDVFDADEVHMLMRFICPLIRLGFNHSLSASF